MEVKVCRGTASGNMGKKVVGEGRRGEDGRARITAFFSMAVGPRSLDIGDGS
jgi:hypothetical protein